LCPSVIALKAIVNRQHTTIVTNTPVSQAIRDPADPDPAIAEPKT
jgi:hypothetical protein